MTLVVVQQKGSVIAAISDTGILEHSKQFPPEKQVPKICILTPDLTVAFAGNPDLAKRYLNEFPESANYKTTVDYLLDRHCEANRQVDFLALFNKPVLKIVQIRKVEFIP